MPLAEEDISSASDGHVIMSDDSVRCLCLRLSGDCLRVQISSVVICSYQSSRLGQGGEMIATSLLSVTIEANPTMLTKSLT